MSAQSTQDLDTVLKKLGMLYSPERSELHLKLCKRSIEYRSMENNDSVVLKENKTPKCIFRDGSLLDITNVAVGQSVEIHTSSSCKALQTLQPDYLQLAPMKSATATVQATIHLQDDAKHSLGTSRAAASTALVFLATFAGIVLGTIERRWSMSAIKYISSS